MTPRRARFFLALAALGIFLGAVSFHLAMRAWRAPFCPDGVRFQPLSSEQMQQTLPILDLHREPVVSLYHSHIQPPLFDSIRAALARFAPDGAELTLVQTVDRGLYQVSTGLYGLIAALLFIWISRLASPLFALAATVAFLPHPAMFYYSTFLEASFLSSAVILLYFVVLWETLAGRRSAVLIALCTLLLFFTRSNFQWPFILLTALAMWIGRLPTREIGRFLVVTVPVAGLFLLKQWFLFGLTLTSSFAGLSASHTVAIFPVYEVNPHLNEARFDNLALPSVLTRRKKGYGMTNLNHLSYLDYNRELLASAAARLASDGWRIQVDRVRENINLYFLPSSSYSAHVLVDALPWRGWYDALFSDGRFMLLLGFAAFVWLAMSRGGDRRIGLALALPAFFIFATSVLLDRGENLRFKWFLEPVFYVFVTTRFHDMWRHFRPVREFPGN